MAPTIPGMPAIAIKLALILCSCRLSKGNRINCFMICGLESVVMVWFMARLTDGCDIPKSSALQSCIFPVAKYRSAAKHFVSGLIGLFLLVGDVILSRCSHFLILSE